jgi:hypothetical protein
MKKHFPVLILILAMSCQKEKSILRDNISIEISTYQDKDRTKAAALPVLKTGSELLMYTGRFDYLLMNIPEIHAADKTKERDSLNSLFPDTLEIKRLYLDHYCQDQKLVKYFSQTYNAIKNPDFQKEAYSADELMEVASKFFYCDKVNPDSSIQMHVCIGLNGLKETRWEKDYTLLSAFCYEAIFNDLDKEDSQIRTAYSTEHDNATGQYRKSVTTLESYLEDVKKNLFDRMKNNAVLKEKLLAYYKLNQGNLAFRIINQ